MLKKITLTIVATILLNYNLYADQYYKYGEWSPDGHGVSDVGGFIDNKGLLSDKKSKGDEYIFFREGDIGYIYKVNVNGDPNAHPDLNGQSIAPRTFTYINQFPVTHSYATGGEFYIDDTGIYYGSGRGIKKWDFNLTSQPDVAVYGIESDTLARNTTTGEWWTATWDRKVYKYNDTNKTWEYQFTYPNLAGWHHDGMEIVNNQLFMSDMTSDKIIVYDINHTTGVVDDPTSYKEYSYTAAPDVEGMGFGPNQHFWIASGWGGTVYEIGNGDLKPTCSQTFHYGTHWNIYRSNCDNITVPGFDDTIMVTEKNGQLKFATADVGATNWLQAHGYTVVPKLKLSSGEAFFTLGKYNTINKTIDNGELTNTFANLHNNVYSLIGFSLAIDLYDKFGNQPVENIYYYSNDTWHVWTPADGSQIIPAGQGFYILPNADFSILIK